MAYRNIYVKDDLNDLLKKEKSASGIIDVALREYYREKGLL